MDTKLGIFIIVLFLIVAVGLKLTFGILGALFSKVGIAIIALGLLAYYIHKKVTDNKDSEEGE